MSNKTLSQTLLLGVVTGLCAHATAQMPSDDDTWKARCNALSANATAIDKGSASQALLQTTRGIAGDKFEAVAHERAGAGQHYIACTLYFTGAMAQHMGNGGKIDAGRAHTDVVLAGAELKRATGQSLSFAEKMDSAGSKMPSVKKTPPLTPADVSAVLGAFNGPGPVPRPASRSTPGSASAQPSSSSASDPLAPPPPPDSSGSGQSGYPPSQAGKMRPKP
jgi:hypothetical protein